jgi:hypothetical protein
MVKSSSSNTQIVTKNTFKKEVIIRSIKILDIAYITFIYGFFSLIIITFLDKYIFPYISLENVKEEEKSKYTIFIELLLCLTIYGIVAYILKNTLQLIPFPLEGVYGFQHLKVTEVKSGAMISMFLLWFSKAIRNKITIFHSKT